jgi:hypothetical protein
MPPLLLTGLGSLGCAAVGMPPKFPEGELVNVLGGGILKLVLVALWVLLLCSACDPARCQD